MKKLVALFVCLGVVCVAVAKPSAPPPPGGRGAPLVPKGGAPMKKRVAPAKKSPPAPRKDVKFKEPSRPEPARNLRPGTVRVRTEHPKYRDRKSGRKYYHDEVSKRYYYYDEHHHRQWCDNIGELLAGGIISAIVDALTPDPDVVVVEQPVVVQPASVIVQPAPVAVQQPVVVQRQAVWVEDAYVDEIQPNGTVIRVLTPGHYEYR